MGVKDADRVARYNNASTKWLCAIHIFRTMILQIFTTAKPKLSIAHVAARWWRSNCTSFQSFRHLFETLPKLSTCSRFVPPLQFCLKFVFQISPPAPNLSKIFPPEWLPCFRFVLNVLTRLVILICMNLSNRIRSLFPYLSPCSRFVQSFFPRVPLLQILHTSSLSSKCLYIYWKLAFGFVSYLPPAPDSIYL